MTDRNIRFPGQPPGNFGMMPAPGMPAYPQQGMQRFPMMQHQGMMMVPPNNPMMQQQAHMFHAQQMGPVGMQPGFAPRPPPYTQQMAENYRQRVPAQQMQRSRARHLSAEELQKQEEQQRKEKQFLAQKQKLQMFGRAYGHVDPDKLIESMFGKTEKVKPKTEAKPKQEESIDDGFGDFMAGPGTFDSSDSVTPSITETTPDLQTTPTTVADREKAKQEKKDLMSMMLECSDLTAPNKAKTFQKPLLKEIHNSHHQPSHTYHQSQQAREWKAKTDEEDLSALFTVEVPSQAVSEGQSPGLQQAEQHLPGQEPVKFELPHWCCDDSNLPDLYKQVLEASMVEGKISTERLYPILLLSGLPKDTLGQLWSLANRTTPGQLIKEELFFLLGIIAFAQNNFKSLTPDMLNKCPQPPVPFLGQGTPHGAPGAPQPPQQPAAGPNVAAPVGPAHQPPPVQNTSPAPVNQPPNMHVGQAGFVAEAVDDFADFQSAPVQAPSVNPVPPKPTATARKKQPEPEYLYEVPRPSEAEKITGPLSPEMMYSSVSNYFGSDESSVSASPQRQLLTGPSTPNSIEDDFDDFKSADSKPSDSSQFTSSEQSENEDFKVFESYLDDFEKKKSEQQESPLHRPVSKSTIPIPKVSNVVPNAIPAVRNLWSTKPESKPAVIVLSEDKSVSNAAPETPKGVTDLQLGSSPSKSSESDFADFQQAPVIKDSQSSSFGSKKVEGNSSLIGDEDKYAALRTLEFGVETTETQDSQEKVQPADEDESWADFQSVDVEPVTNTETSTEQNNVNKDNILSLFNSKPKTDSEWADFESGQTIDNVVPVVDEQNSEWSDFSTSTATTVKEDDWSNFSSSDVQLPAHLVENIQQPENTENNQEDWADFQEPQQTESNDAPDQQGLVCVKKENLQTNEILGLFKVRETAELPSDLKLFNMPPKQEQGDVSENVPDEHPPMKSNKISVSSLDEDPFRIPPPMEDINFEDEVDDYSRGYNIEDYDQPKQVNPGENKRYGVHGMGVVSKSSKTSNKTDIMALDQENIPASKDVSQLPSLQDKLTVTKNEDSQSVSSLDLQFTKTRLQNVQDADNQSISSNEFVGNFDATKEGTPTNIESKSVDSLDLKRAETEFTEEQTSSGSNSEKEQSPEKQIQQQNERAVPAQSTLPVLGDRYSSIMEDIPGSDKHVYEWQRCLDNCYRMVKDANNIFNSISSSSVCNEVLRSEQGSEYVQGVVEIYRVVCRITTAMKSTAMSTEKLKHILKDIDLAWNNLTAFLVGGNLMPDDNSLSFTNAILKSDDSVSQMKACGVCLLNVDVPSKNFNREEECAKLTYGRRQYHASCANLWVNCVDTLLPALKLPELL